MRGRRSHHNQLLQKNERAEEMGEGRAVMRDSEGAGKRERERWEKREGEGRQHLLTAEPFIDKVALCEPQDCSWTHHTLFITLSYTHFLGVCLQADATGTQSLTLHSKQH